MTERMPTIHKLYMDEIKKYFPNMFLYRASVWWS